MFVDMPAVGKRTAGEVSRCRRPESARLVQSKARDVLGEDTGLDGPDPAHFGDEDQLERG
jgi:hypothetical protein